MLAVLVLAFSSCAPQAFVINPQMRAASKSGLNLSGKSMAVVYVGGNESRDALFNASIANGFASRLEEDYFGGKEVIGVFKMDLKKNADYSSKDSLVNLVMDTGKDVVFLFDSPELGVPVISDPAKVSGTSLPADSSYLSSVSIPFVTKLYVYDSMDKSDKVRAYVGKKEIKPDLYSDGKTSKQALALSVWNKIAPAAEVAGYQAAASFMSTWKEDNFLVIYYDGAEKAWDRGAEQAYAFQWKEAISSWMTLLKNRNKEKRACASYNIALGCFLSGQPDLALEWLDRSDQDTPVSLSKDLRAKIKEYTGR